MISRIARLRAKKGFTIVELIVVIAIITILLAMVIPMVYYDTKPAVARSMAKEFYYKVQEVLTDCKAINAPIPANYTCYFADLDEKGEVVKVGSFTVDVYTMENETVYAANTTDVIGGKMREMMYNYLTSDLTRDMTGRLIAACDTKYRVCGTYWVENFDLFEGGTEFSDENILATGEYCCAFPLPLCAPGAKTFRFSDLGIS